MIMVKLDNYNDMKSSVDEYIRLGQDSGLAGLSDNAEGFYNLHKLVSTAIEDAHIFRLDEDITDLLLETENEIRYEKPPFPSTFIDTKIKISEKKELRGVLILDLPEIEPDDLPESEGISDSEGEDLFVTSFLYGEGAYEELDMEKAIGESEKHEVMKGLVEKTGFFVGGTLGKETGLWGPEGQTEKKRTLEKLTVNFLDFLHNPDIEWIEKTGKPSGRTGKGFSTCPVCGSNKASKEAIDRHIEKEHPEMTKPARTVKLSGKTKRYVQRYKSMDSEERRKVRAHWVRGHYRHLKSDYYTNKQGQKIWIPPHLRGKGVLVPKAYDVEE
jgi:hypothetical protein